MLGRCSRSQADTVLSDLAKKGKIRRVARGIYDYPAWSDLLGQYLSPDMDWVARAYARKNNWRIEITGEAAMNLMALSNQVTAKYMFLSDGPNRTYQTKGGTLRFKHANLKTIGFKYRESILLVQGIKALGKAHISEKAISNMREYIAPERREKILKDCKSTTDWIYEVIKEVCRPEESISK
ncbi:hypothetical protein NBRC116495_28820 [Aurantivibrio plasticivorans]